MSDVYGFRGGPSFSAARREDLFASAMERPMSLGSTFFDQTVGGTVSSYGIGTAYRDAVTPQGNTSELSNMERAGRAAGQLLNPLGAVVGNVKRLMGEAQPSMTEEAYRASPYYRQSVPWDASMTEDRAAALATQWDTKAVRDFYAEKRPITSFFGNLAGQAADPINYIPVTGPAVRAAAIARMGMVRGIAANAALDASLNTAIAGMVTRETRRGFGDDVSWQAMVTEIATAALIGGAFGTVGGVLERRAGSRAATVRAETEQRLSTLRTVQESRVALNEAIGGLANDGEIRLSPNATEPMARIAREVEAFVPVVERPEFKSWFGESRVVDEGGAPLVMYHGTTANVDQFDVGKVASRFPNSKGFYFVSRPNRANAYADYGNVGTNYNPNSKMAKPVPDGANVMPVYLSLKNPKIITQTPDTVKGAVTPEGIVDTPAGAAMIDEAKAAGHDGVLIHRKFGDPEYDETFAIAFNPTQIKSKFNTGKFSSDDPRVIDASPARPDPIPEGRIEAESRTAKPDDYKALASQYRVDPETGKFDEEAELRQLETEGRLTEDDAADMEAADETYQDSASYGEALKAAVGCLL